MSAGFKVHKLLLEKGIDYETLKHDKCLTAFGTAVLEHIPPQAYAKTVIVKIRGNDVMFVLPASRKMDLLKVSTAFGTQNLRIEEENEFKGIFTDSEVGAMPPFGELYGLPVYLDSDFKRQKEIYFNAGSHQETLKIPMEDYLRCSKVIIGDFSTPRYTQEGKCKDLQVYCG